MYMLITSYQNILELNKMVSNLHDVILNDEEQKHLIQFLTTCEETFVIDNLSSIRSPIFKNGVFGHVDILQKHIDEEIQKIENIMKGLNLKSAKLDYLQKITDILFLLIRTMLNKS